MASPNFVPPRPPVPVPVTPSLERWRDMTAEQREQFIIGVNIALSDPAITMAEGRPHKKAKSKALDRLGLHFRALGKHVYLAEELAVLYPGVAGFTPDVMAVLDVEEPEDDRRMAWVVANEGKGLDWVLEVLWAGDRQKDLVENVEKYARLGIPEYFVYDQKVQRIVGYRLPVGGNRYQPIIPQAGLYRSNVLGIDLAVVNDSLRFYHGSAELYDTQHIIARLESMVASLQERAEQADRNAETAQRDAEKSCAAIREAVIDIMTARNVPCSARATAQLEACSNADQLRQWLRNALAATTEADVFGSDTPAG